MNKILLITIVTWTVAQFAKVVNGYFHEKRFNFGWFIGTGGMPSSHAAGVVALATACGLETGFDSVVFGLAAVFAIVTMFDAQGVRRETGQQAEILNKMMEDLYWKGKIEEGRLKEFIGHTPFQVFVGALLGYIVALFLHRILA